MHVRCLLVVLVPGFVSDFALGSKLDGMGIELTERSVLRCLVGWLVQRRRLARPSGEDAGCFEVRFHDSAQVCGGFESFFFSTPCPRSPTANDFLDFDLVSSAGEEYVLPFLELEVGLSSRTSRARADLFFPLIFSASISL